MRVELRNLLVRAPADNEMAREELVSELSVTTLAVDDDHITVEWADDELTFTPAIAVDAETVEQHTLPLEA